MIQGASPGGSKMGRDRTPRYANILLLLVAFAVAVLLLGFLYEVVENIRYAKWRDEYHRSGDHYGHLAVASTNPGMIWEYRPNATGGPSARHIGKDVVATIKTNRYGFRDLDYEFVDKPDGVIRIAFVGDSVTLGLWVDDQDIFVRKFEDEANRRIRGRRVQGLNFGIDGYNTVQIYAMLRDRVIRFSNDQVVYVMCLNDFDFEEAASQKIRYFRKPRSFLWGRLKRAAYNYRRRMEKDYHFFHYGENRDVVYETILQMRDLLAGQGVGFRIAIVPVFDFDEDDFDSYKYIAIHGEIKEFLTTNGIEVLDLLDVFKEGNLDPRSYAYDVWHPNGRGHQVIAGALVGFVLAEYENSGGEPARQ